MSVVKRIVCLANSRKMQGRCVAGRELNADVAGPWIRPVSDRPTEEVSEYERQYQDGSDPRVLDVIDVPLIEARPKDYQQENWLLDPQLYWERRGRLRWDDLSGLQDRRGPLWVNGNSSYNGLNDRIPLAQATALRSSLKLIHVRNLELRVFAPGEAFGNTKRRVQARFTFDGTDYWLWVTDPIVERKYLAEPDGEYAVGEAYLTVSIGEPYQDHCYKLVATVLGRT
jgi:Dual OB-containing domain